MKVVRTSVLATTQRKRTLSFYAKVVVLTPIYLLLAAVRKCPGIYLRATCAGIGLRVAIARCGIRGAVRWLYFPLDSVRYFELEALRRELRSSNRPVSSILDVSSPRLALFLEARACPTARMHAVNPDLRDLKRSRRLAECLGVAPRFHFEATRADDLQAAGKSFDIVSSISVLEHLQPPSDKAALAKLWNLVAPGGRLILSVPCAGEAFEEHIDLDEYGLSQRLEDGYYFSQTFFDESELRRRFFSVTGPPVRVSVFGERVAGAWSSNRFEKVNDATYPIWREPWMMASEYRRFRAVRDLPGVGVVFLVFEKADK